MKLVELIKGDKTSNDSLSTALDFVKLIGKAGLLKKYFQKVFDPFYGGQKRIDQVKID